MADQSEASSTEKLLDLIRNGHDDGPAGFDTAQSPLPGKKQPLGLFRRGEVTLGVELTPGELRLAKIRRTSEKKRELLDVARFAIDPAIPRTSQEFINNLRGILSRFCGRDRIVKIWAGISHEQAVIRFLRIPKVGSKEVSNAVLWTFKREAPFNEKEVIFDYEILGDVVHGGVTKSEVVACTAPEREVSELKRIFASCGYPLEGITALPFGLQNLFRTQRVIDTGNVCALVIGEDASRIDIFSDRNLVFSRSIKAGLNGLIESVQAGYQERQPLGPEVSGESGKTPEPGARRQTKNELSYESVRQILLKSLEGPCVISHPLTGEEIQQQEIVDLVEPALSRLVRQVEMTIKHFNEQIDLEPIGKLYLPGSIGGCAEVIKYITDQLAIQVEYYDPLFMGIAPVTMQIGAISTIDQRSERAIYTETIGLALSNNEMTPNFLYTYKDVEAEKSSRRVNVVAVVAAIVVFLVLIGFHLYQNIIISDQSAQVDKVKKQVAGYKPLVTKEKLLNLVTRHQNAYKRMQQRGERYLGAAIVSELSRKLPSDIRFRSIVLSLPADLSKYDQKTGPAAEKEKAKPKEGTINKKIQIEGIVIGKKEKLEAELAKYLLKIEDSSIFFGPTITKREPLSFEMEDALGFEATVGVK